MHTELSYHDRVEITDALYRFGAGQDLREAALFASAFSPDAILDFTQPAQRLGMEMALLEGREHFLNHHLKRQYRMDYEAVLPSLLKEPRTLEFLDTVRIYEKNAAWRESACG